MPLPLRFALSRGSGRDESQGSVTRLAPTASRRLTSLVRLQLRYESQRAAVDPSQGPSARFLIPAHRHQYLDCGDCPLQPVAGTWPSRAAGIAFLGAPGPRSCGRVREAPSPASSQAWPCVWPARAVR